MPSKGLWELVFFMITAHLFENLVKIQRVKSGKIYGFCKRGGWSGDCDHHEYITSSEIRRDQGKFWGLCYGYLQVEDRVQIPSRLHNSTMVST